MIQRSPNTECSLCYPKKHKRKLHMKLRRAQNIPQAERSLAEAWMWKKLTEPGRRWFPWRWERQKVWQWRILDFFERKHGVAIEVDGPEHDRKTDSAKDRKLTKWTKGIIVFRVRNFNEDDAARVLSYLESCPPLVVRRRIRRAEIDAKRLSKTKA